MTADDDFKALHTGPNALMSITQARLEVGHYLGVSPLATSTRFVSEEDLAEAVFAVRSYWAIAHIIERDPPLGAKDGLDEVRRLLAPERTRRQKSKPSITPNKLWSKTSY